MRYPHAARALSCVRPALLGRASWVALALLLAGAALAGGELAGGVARAAAVILLLAAALYALSRRGRPSLPGAFTVVERCPLAKESGVALISVAGRRLVLGYAPGAVTLLAELAAPVEEGAP